MSDSLAGQMQETARGAVSPAVREARISRVLPGGRVMVTVRSLTGDIPELGPCPGADPKTVWVDDVPTERLPARGDLCWVAEANSGLLVVVAYEAGS